MDAMSDAIEGAAVMLYGVSLAYKESANCRLEANYAHQQELDMIPLMMQQDYKPQGWCKLQQRAFVFMMLSSCLLTWDHSAGSGLDDGHAALVCDVGRGAR